MSALTDVLKAIRAAQPADALKAVRAARPADALKAVRPHRPDTVLAAVRAGRTDLVPALLEPLDATQRKAILPELKDLRRELRTGGWENWKQRDLMSPALVVAGAGCTTGAAAAATWISAADLRRWRPRVPTEILLTVLADRDQGWLGKLADRLAARPATAADDYPLISALARRADHPMPTTDGCVEGWVTAVSAGRNDRPLADVLREHAHTPAFVPRLFETAEPVAAFAWRSDPDNRFSWPTALATLTAEGLLDRATLLDACTTRLVRGGTANQLKPYQNILAALAPTEQEERERAADWIAIAADAPSAVAGDAQQTLARIASTGHLTSRQLAEMSAAVLFRPEKKLVRAQLTLIARELKRDRATAPDLLPELAELFGHTDTDLQGRGLKVVAAHLPDDPALRAELAARAQLLAPLHRPRALQVLGPAAVPAEDTAPYEETLPPVPAPTPLDPSPATPEETAELVAALVNARTGAPTVAEFERALDGVARHAHRDRSALTAALRDALADIWWLDPQQSRHYHHELPGLEHLAAVLLGAAPRCSTAPAFTSWRHDCAHGALRAVVHARVVEVASRLAPRPRPVLLATPTTATGPHEPRTLGDPLTAYARRGETPAPIDFGQALLRVRRDPTAASEAAALGTPEGHRLAAWLETAGAPVAVTRRIAPPVTHQWRPETPARLALDTGEHATVLAEFPTAFHDLAKARPAPDACWEGAETALLAVLPEDRETLAAWQFPLVRSAALHDMRGGAATLPLLAALEGPAGPALHLAVATGLGARHPQDRLSAVDALLTLAARGDLDPVRLAADLTEQITLGAVKPNRLTDSLSTAAATGAYATTWSVLAAALPALLAENTRGTGDLLALAAECVEHARAASPAPAGLDAAADRRGTSRLTTQAARLRDALHRNQEPAPAPLP
ncbi:DUF6493 family protein [Streptomyces sp. NPDC060194]|uniref:DUF6493 family protein n=1 Tax=Streptomyces sp. NPDC060194 TaxID=3347069 RepID=UPI00366A4AE9